MARFCIRFARLRIIVPLVLLIACIASVYVFISQSPDSSHVSSEYRDVARDNAGFKRLDKPNDLSDLFDVKSKEMNRLIQENRGLKRNKVGDDSRKLSREQQSMVGGQFVPGGKLDSKHLSGKIAGIGPKKKKGLEPNVFGKSPDVGQPRLRDRNLDAGQQRLRDRNPDVNGKQAGMMYDAKKRPVGGNRAPVAPARGKAPVGAQARGNAPAGAPPRGKAPVGAGGRGKVPAGALQFQGQAGGDFAAGAAQRKAQRYANTLALQKKDPELVCKSPELKPFDDSIRHLLQDPDKIHCNGSTLTYLAGGRFMIDRTQTIGVKYDSCFYSYIERVDDDMTRLTDPKKVRLIKQGSALDFKPKNDFTILACQRGPQRNQIDIIDEHDPSMHVDVHAHVIERAQVKETCLRYLKKRHKDSMGLNVILFGIESTSRMNFMRQMPKSYRALNRMGATTLSGYNIVGDSTTGNLIPLLVSRHESELPDVRRDANVKKYLDQYNFIWNSFSNKGYVTMYAEDQPKMSTFNLRLNGFERPPTDHYMRPFWHQEQIRGQCLGPKPAHKIMLDYTSEFMQSYKKFPKFGLTFFTGLTHSNINKIQAMDDDLAAFLETSQKSGALNNTMFILFSDHGARYKSIRETMQGKLEERLPFMSILLPAWFKNSRPGLYANLMKNYDRLTTPFDIYETMQSVLYHSETIRGGYKRRGISLFNEIPKSRTCEEAGIDPHWCSCMQWKSTSNQNMTGLAKSLIGSINEITRPYRKMCMDLSFLRIVRVDRLEPIDEVMRFRGTKDKDEREPDFHARHTVNVHSIPLMYQMTVETMPGRAMFEGTMKVEPGLNDAYVAFQVQGQIKRINNYGYTANCIEKDHPDMAPYCFCKNYIGMPVAFMGASEKDTKVVSHST